MADKDLLQEQIAYYRARAPEYDQSLKTQDQLEPFKRSLRAMPAVADVVELACGTGIWTGDLLKIGGTVTAIDASPEMLAINRARIADLPSSGGDRVRYQEADLFAWEPERQYDLLFAAFWLSHVPPGLMEAFLDKIGRAVRPSGTVYIVDQCDDIREDMRRIAWEGVVQKRRVRDGRVFSLVKVYYHPSLLAGGFEKAGFSARAERVGESFFSIVGRRRA
jgi:SAM-dependent methyltransferase